MQEFSFSTKIYFGEGALERLRWVKHKNVAIVTDHFLVSIGIVEKISAYLEDCNIRVFQDVVPDPPIEVITAGVQALTGFNTQAMIAVGGGSTIDAAKAIRAVASQIGVINELDMECFAIPTTSGTGSEVTEYAVISDRAKGIKYPLDSHQLLPSVAILDPALASSAPARVTADAGMDVLTHALEAYVSTGANDFSDALCEKAISLVFRFLPLAVADGQDQLAREKMHNASCMAGLAFNSAGLGVNHAIAHAVGGKLHIAHGCINAMLLPHVIGFNANLSGTKNGEFSIAARKYQRIAKILDMSAPSVRLGVINLIREVEKLNRAVHTPVTLKEWGADAAKVKELHDDMIAAALADITLKTNPRSVSQTDAHNIIALISGRH